MSPLNEALEYVDGLIECVGQKKKISLAQLLDLKEILEKAQIPTATPVYPIKPVKMGLFPQMDSLQSVIELGYSQLPITNKNSLLGLIMTYHNSLILTIEREKIKGT